MGVVRKLEQAFMDGFTAEEACRVSGIARSTYYKHLAENERFSDKMAGAQNYLVIKARHTICVALDTGNVKIAKWFLERKRREEFSLRYDLRTAPTRDEFVDLTDEELNMIIHAGEATLQA